MSSTPTTLQLPEKAIAALTLATIQSNTLRIVSLANDE
jgi:hypothetical protein